MTNDLSFPDHCILCGGRGTYLSCAVPSSGPDICPCPAGDPYRRRSAIYASIILVAIVSVLLYTFLSN